MPNDDWDKYNKQINDQVNSIWRFVRDYDGKEFRVTLHGHWSDIESADGEKYSIKCLGGWGKRGGDSYVSHEGVLFSKIRIA